MRTGPTRDPGLAASRTHAAYLALGHERVRGPGVYLVREPRAPAIYDANLLLDASADTPEAAQEALAFAEREMRPLGHRHAVCGPETPAAFSAALAQAGHRPKPTLQLLLDGPLAGPAPAPCEIRSVSGEPDWGRLHSLLRADHSEGARTSGPLAPEITAQMLLTKRAKAPALRFFLASIRGRDVGFFSAWPGVDGVGIVEDLFVLPQARGRGVARALVHHAVGDARARGAERVLIGADPADTPRLFYAALGFRPVCLTWSWLRSAAGS